MNIKRIDYKDIVSGNDRVRFDIDNDAARAIRWICGYNPDLRVSLSGHVIEDKIFKMIKDNKYQLLDIDYSITEPHLQDYDTFSEYWEAYEKWVRPIRRLVAEIMR